MDSTIIVEVMCKALPDITMDEVKQLQAVVAGSRAGTDRSCYAARGHSYHKRITG